jgi:hypothetical protein
MKYYTDINKNNENAIILFDEYITITYMTNDIYATVLLVVFIIIIGITIPLVMKYGCVGEKNGRENFTAEQKFQEVVAIDPEQQQERLLHPRGSMKDYESLIFDNTTGSIMSGSQFMENTGIVAPPWIAPAWDPDAYGPSSKGELDPADFENDPRMLYNKCSLSCCGPQYPTPFQGSTDPFVCSGDVGNGKKYLSSSFTCQNNTGGVGCLCMTPKQADGMSKKFVDYYANKELGY